MQLYKIDGYTEKFVNEWLARYPDDPIISAYKDTVRDIEAQVFSSIDDFSIPHIECKNKPTFKGTDEMNKDGKGKLFHESETGEKQRLKGSAFI